MTQTRKVYGAEATTFANVMAKSYHYQTQEMTRCGALFVGRDAVIEFANAALAAVGCKPLRSFVTGWGSSGWTRPWDRRMCLPRFAWNRGYILHEVAHQVAYDYGFNDATGDPHDAGFTGTMLGLVAVVCGRKVAEELARDYREAWCEVSERAFTNIVGRGIKKEAA